MSLWSRTLQAKEQQLQRPCGRNTPGMLKKCKESLCRGVERGGPRVKQ